MKSGEADGTYNLHGVVDFGSRRGLHEFALDYVRTIKVLFWNHAFFEWTLRYEFTAQPRIH